MSLFNPSGGLTYHYLAWRYKNTLWLNYRKSLATWLYKWNPHERNIILIGASGGYNLPNEFLKKFENIYVFDPDILAPYFFRKNHPQLNLKWSNKDILGVDEAQVKNLTQKLSEYSDSAVLFCNLIGQLPLLLQKKRSQIQTSKKMQDTEIEDFLQKLASQIFTLGDQDTQSKKRSVASFHDIYSRNLKAGQENILRDHMTHNLFSEKYWHKDQLLWNLTPNEEHRIECVYRK